MEKYKKGDIVRVNVTGIESYGAFVNLDEYYKGLIHISEISDGFVKNINDYVKIGETIYAKVLDVREDENKVRLSIKNIRYRIKKRRRAEVRETTSKFEPLKNNLDKWINEKLEEIDK